MNLTAAFNLETLEKFDLTVILIVSIIALVLSSVAIFLGTLQPAAITNLAEGSVGTAEFANNAVTGAKISIDTITDANIVPTGISRIANNAIGSGHIIDSSLTMADFSADVVNTINAGGDGGDGGTIADNSVTSLRIQDASILLVDLNSEVIDAMSGNTTVDVENGSITTEKIADEAVTSIKIKNETITSSDIAPDAVGSSEIATDAVGADELAAGAVTWGDITGNPFIVVAAGDLTLDAVIMQNYNIDSALWNATNDRYEISLTGIDYVYRDYITIVQPISTGSYMTSTDSVDNKLLISIFDENGNPDQKDFHFVVFKIV
jgi:hypothetical protein